MSLLAAVIQLSPGQSLPADRPWPGRAAQAWLLAQVRRADPVLANALHDGQVRRPYTIAVLRSKGEAEDQYWLRVTSLAAPLSNLLADKILPYLDASLTLAGLDWQIGDVQTENHAWAGRSDYDRLAREVFDSASTTISPGLEFATPTAFHSGGLSVPLPLPLLVYGSLIQAWNTYSPVRLPIALNTFLGDYVGVARHRIATRIVISGQERHVGFTGIVRYMLRPQDKTGLTADEYRQRVQAIALLTQFAFYAGIGIRTSAGMGQARPL